MKPSDILKFVQSQDKTIQKLEDATKYFEVQKNAIGGIKNTTGFQEIKNYFYRQYDAAATKKVDHNNAWEVAYKHAQMDNARDFLSFLDNILGW